MPTVAEIAAKIEELAPLPLQESYDNAGLICGDPSMNVDGVLVSLDVTEEIVDEAISRNSNLIVSHHPLIFGGIKKITTSGYVGRSLLKAIKNDVAIYAAHTNLDNVKMGVNRKIADKIGLTNLRILSPKAGTMKKLVTFCPDASAEEVRSALFEAGAGKIGDYDSCSYNTSGKGTFRGGEASNPFVGVKGTLHSESETRIEMVFPTHLENKLVEALLKSHPYEEVAYDIITLDNRNPDFGAGMIGILPTPTPFTKFLTSLKQKMELSSIRHTSPHTEMIATIALCGGSGSFLIRDAISAKADLFITADMKYHQFFDAEGRIIIADIGHYESERFTSEIFIELITRNFPNFAVHLTELNTNPINYF